MSYHHLDPGHTGVLFFDMLNVYFRGADEEAQRRMEPIVANCVRIVKAARTASIPIFYAKADHRTDWADSVTLITDTDHSLRPWPDPAHQPAFRPASTQGSWKAEVIDELKPEPGDYVVLKHRWSAFHQTHLELSMRTRGIDTVVLAGGATEVGIASTVYSARDRDFNLVIVHDACSSSHQGNHDQFMKCIFPRMARIRSTDQVIEMMRKA